MARTPQSFEKRQRERRKQQKREEKLERRLIRSEEKRMAKDGVTYEDLERAEAEREEGAQGDEPRTPRLTD